MPRLKKKYHLGEKLISNTFYLFLDWFFIALFSFIFWLILGKTLNPSDVGIASTAISLMTFICTFSSLGIVNALNKLIPEIKEKEGIKGVYSFVKSSIKPLIISQVIIFLVLLIFSNYLSTFVKIPYYVYLICVFSIIVISFSNFLGSVLYGLQNMKKYFLADTIEIIIRLLITIFLIFLGFSFFSPVIGYTVAILLVLFFRFNSDYFKNKGTNSYKKLFSYSTPAFVTSIAGSLITKGEYIILTILKTTEITGIFTMAFIIASVIGVLTDTPNVGLFPILSALSVNKKN